MHAFVIGRGSNNVPQLDLTGIYGTLGTCLILIAPLTKFSLNCNPVAFGIEEWFGIGECEGDRDGSVPASKRAARLAVRTSLVVAALFVAIACPSFGLVVAVVGSFASMAVAAISPPMLYLGIFRGRLPAWELEVALMISVFEFARGARGRCIVTTLPLEDEELSSLPPRAQSPPDPHAEDPEATAAPGFSARGGSALDLKWAAPPMASAYTFMTSGRFPALAAGAPRAPSAVGRADLGYSAVELRELLSAPHLSPQESDLSLLENKWFIALLKVVGYYPPFQSRALSTLHLCCTLLAALFAPTPWIVVYAELTSDLPYHLPAAALGFAVLELAYLFGLQYFRRSRHGWHVTPLASRMLKEPRRRSSQELLSRLVYSAAFVGTFVQGALAAWWLWGKRDFLWRWPLLAATSFCAFVIPNIGAMITVGTFLYQTQLFVWCFDEAADDVRNEDGSGSIVRAVHRYPAIAELVESAETAWAPLAVPLGALAALAFAYMGFVFTSATGLSIVGAVTMAACSAAFLVAAARVTAAAVRVREAAGYFILPGGGAEAARSGSSADEAAARFLRYFSSRDQARPPRTPPSPFFPSPPPL
eukprot:tig00000430_g602.t1